MPLIKSSSKSARETNIKEMIASGHKPAQAVAAAYHNQREVRAHQGHTHHIKHIHHGGKK